jgi:hypothetical protein
MAEASHTTPIRKATYLYRGDEVRGDEGDEGGGDEGGESNLLIVTAKNIGATTKNSNIKITTVFLSISADIKILIRFFPRPIIGYIPKYETATVPNTASVNHSTSQKLFRFARVCAPKKSMSVVLVKG